jgi:hypothetical protein
LMTRLYMASAMAKDRLPTAATASFEVDRYTAVGKNLGVGRKGSGEISLCVLAVCRPGAVHVASKRAVCALLSCCFQETHCLRVANAW